ncbi:hypothetical protein AGDE_12821 [Angomonas deanei]|nr:hypothetical protein AGDE_12821 [Angomonas deanei]|eukprot:EPY23425.1 hypothetical protein AGDE_12821 [Angomonas deanei]
MLHDGSNTCMCTVHGDITSRYPNAVSTSAVLVFTNISVIVMASNVPPLLVACFDNLVGLLLPEEDTAPSQEFPSKGTTAGPADRIIPSQPAALHPYRETADVTPAVAEESRVPVIPIQTNHSDKPCPVIDSDEDCLEMADDH